MEDWKIGRLEARHVRFKALTAVLDLGGYGPETGSHRHLGRFCWSLATKWRGVAHGALAVEANTVFFGLWRSSGRRKG